MPNFVSPRLIMTPSLSVNDLNGAKSSVHPNSACPVASNTRNLSLPNPSLQVTPDHKIKLVEAPIKTPKRGEVLLHIKATGICGQVIPSFHNNCETIHNWIHRSDIHFWKTGRIGELIFSGDGIIGHEAAGIVLQCGEGVRDLKPGKNLFLTPIYETRAHIRQAIEWQ